MTARGYERSHLALTQLAANQMAICMTGAQGGDHRLHTQTDPPDSRGLISLDSFVASFRGIRLDDQDGM